MKLKPNDTVIIKKVMIQNPGKITKVKEVLSSTQVTLEIDNGMFTYGIDSLIKVDIMYYMPSILKFISYAMIAFCLSYLFDKVLPFKGKFFAGAMYAITAYFCFYIIEKLSFFNKQE